MYKSLNPLALSLMLLTGCASIVPPSASSLAQVPVVKYGTEAPQQQKFVLLYPAGTPLPVLASIKGSLFEKTDEATLEVKLKNDLYVYDGWVSLDGKNWTSKGEVVKGEFGLTLPGWVHGNEPGTLHAEFNAIK
jgi:hypothetical protein